MPPPVADAPVVNLSGRVRSELLDAFTADELEMLVSDHLPVKLAWVSADRPLEVVAFELVEWAGRHDTLPLLLAAAAAARPHRGALAALRDECGAAGRPADGGGDPAAVVAAVVRFNERFTDRRKRLAELEIYKGLHDVLHNLQMSLPEVRRLVAAPAGDDAVVAGDLADRLSKWAQMADVLLPPADDEDQRTWVAEFVRVVGVVAARLNGGPPTAELDKAVRLLAHLPEDKQPALNRELKRVMKEFDVTSLGEPLDGLRSALPPGDAAELLERFVAFQTACGRMKRLNDQHQLCQWVDMALREPNGLSNPTAAAVDKWPGARERLDRLAAVRSTDPVAKRVIQSADKFAAVAAPALAALRHHFGRLFYAIDSELLVAIGRVLHSAEVLDALLSRHLS